MDQSISKNWDFITNNNMNILILFGLIFAGIFIKLFLGNHSSEMTGQASSTVWGYGLTTISLFTLMFVVLSNDLNPGESTLNLILNAGLPIFSLIVILIYIIGINMSYFTIINKNFVPEDFSRYSTISSILIIFQLMIIFQFSKSLVKKNRKDDDFINRIIYVSYIFTGLNFILAIIMNIIVKFFTTDG